MPEGSRAARRGRWGLTCCRQLGQVEQRVEASIVQNRHRYNEAVGPPELLVERLPLRLVEASVEAAERGGAESDLVAIADTVAFMRS